jgi:hypothetical protein
MCATTTPPYVRESDLMRVFASEATGECKGSGIRIKAEPRKMEGRD